MAQHHRIRRRAHRSSLSAQPGATPSNPTSPVAAPRPLRKAAQAKARTVRHDAQPRFTFPSHNNGLHQLASAIDAAFGSFADFKGKLKETGVNQFGSGWSWLVHDGSGLAIVGTPNQDTPLSDGKTPLLGVDVWEHAYYLQYQNRRPDYIDAWWNVVDWSRIAERFSAAG